MRPPSIASYSVRRADGKRLLGILIGSHMVTVTVDGAALKAALKWAIIAAAGVFLFKVGHAYATADRGYEAVGGEYLFLFLPLWWWLAEAVIRR